jgi:hypothetical protein
MPHYLVSQKVRTVAGIFDEHRIDQFVFRPFEPELGANKSSLTAPEVPVPVIVTDEFLSLPER